MNAIKKLKDAITKGSKNEEEKTELNAQDIVNGLTLISNNIKEAHPERIGNPIQVIVSGGACSVLLLKNRATTHDIDFYSPEHDIYDIIYDAKHQCGAAVKQFPPAWINGDMIAFVLNKDGCEGLFEESVASGLTLFRSDVLVAFVADWKYQLVGKITRAYREEDSRHLSDAVSILHIIVHANRGQPIAKSVVKTWYHEGPLLEDEEIKYTNEAYIDQFGAPGIVM